MFELEKFLSKKKDFHFWSNACFLVLFFSNTVLYQYEANTTLTNA